MIITCFTVSAALIVSQFLEHERLHRYKNAYRTKNDTIMTDIIAVEIDEWKTVENCRLEMGHFARNNLHCCHHSYHPYNMY